MSDQASQNGKKNISQAGKCVLFPKINETLELDLKILIIKERIKKYGFSESQNCDNANAELIVDGTTFYEKAIKKVLSERSNVPGSYYPNDMPYTSEVINNLIKTRREFYSNKRKAEFASAFGLDINDPRVWGSYRGSDRSLLTADEQKIYDDIQSNKPYDGPLKQEYGLFKEGMVGWNEIGNDQIAYGSSAFARGDPFKASFFWFNGYGNKILSPAVGLLNLGGAMSEPFAGFAPAKGASGVSKIFYVEIQAANIARAARMKSLQKVVDEARLTNLKTLEEVKASENLVKEIKNTLRGNGGTDHTLVSAAEKANDSLNAAKGVAEKANGSLRDALSKFYAAVGEPVSVATGEYLETWHDFNIEGLIPFSGARYMGLKMPMNWCGPLGYCQISLYDEIITNPQPGHLSYFDTEGREITFLRPFNYLPSENAAFPHLQLTAPWLKQLELKDCRTIKKFKQYSDKIYHLESIEDLNGNRLVLNRDDSGFLLNIISSDGLKLEFTNDNRGCRLSTTLIGLDGTKQILSQYSYDDKGRMLSANCQFGMSVYYEWHETNNLITRWHNRTKRSETYFSYDDEGRVIHTATTGLWNNDRFEYDPQNGLTTYFPAGDISRAQIYQYKDDQNIIAEIDALGGVTRYTYDKAGFRNTITDANGNKTNIKHDIWGNIRQQTDAENRSTIFAWGDNGELDKKIDPAGNVWTYDNDQFGLIVAQKDAEGNITKFKRNQRGQIIETILPNGAVQKNFYHKNGWLQKTINSTADERHFVYDEFGRIVVITDTTGQTTRYIYEAKAGGFNTPSKIIRADGASGESHYDADGLITTKTDGEGRTIKYKYGAFDVLQSIENNKGDILNIQYDSNGNIISVKNALGRVYHLKRDVAERIVEEVDFDGRITHYERDAAGQVTKLIKPDGAFLTFLYDKTGLVTRIEAFDATSSKNEVANDTVTLTYDACGQLKSAENKTALVQFKRNKNGIIVEENINGRRVKTKINSVNAKIEQSIFSGIDQINARIAYHNVQFDRRKNSQINQLTIGDHKPLNFEYDQRGFEIKRETLAGFRLAQTHDKIGQLTKQQAGVSIQSFGKGLKGLQEASLKGILPDAATQLERIYAWDKASSPTEIADAIWGKTQYTYNDFGQVKQSKNNSNDIENYNYDAADNLCGISHKSLDKSNKTETLLNWQSTPSGVITLAKGPNGEVVKLKHDACGRVVERIVERHGFRPNKWVYNWDAFDRMISVVTPQGERWTIGYDAFGRRIHKINVNAAKIAQQRQGIINIKELQNRGAYYEESKTNNFGEKHGQIIVGTQFMWASDLMVEEADMLADGSADWQSATHWYYEEGTAAPLAKQMPNGELFYIVNDHLGTPREMFSEDGQLVWSIKLSTWGVVKGVKKRVIEPDNDNFIFAITPSKSRGNLALKQAPIEAAYDCPIRFQGQWQDEETGLYYNRYRYYDPLTAQYISPDPIGFAGGIRLNGYVLNPIKQVDIKGLNARLPKRLYDGPSKQFFHYTTNAGEEGIKKAKAINASKGYGRARHGDGVYISDIDPKIVVWDAITLTAEQKKAGKITVEELKRRLYIPQNVEITKALEIDVAGQKVFQGLTEGAQIPRNHIFMIEATESLPINILSTTP